MDTQNGKHPNGWIWRQWLQIRGNVKFQIALGIARWTILPFGALVLKQVRAMLKHQPSGFWGIFGTVAMFFLVPVVGILVRQWSRRAKRAVAGIGLVAFAGWIYITTTLDYSNPICPPSVSVYADFTETWHQYDLGCPKAMAGDYLSKDDATKRAGPEQHFAIDQFDWQKARVIYIDQIVKYLILAPGRPLQEMNAPDDPGSDLYSLKARKAVLKAPKGYNPPYGGFLLLFEQDRARWEGSLGWLDWHCLYRSHVIHFQQFEKGWIYGTFRTNANSDDLTGRALVRFADDTWEFPRTSAKAVPCEILPGDSNEKN